MLCEKCFGSISISNYIKEVGEKLKKRIKCDFCENESYYRINEDDFKVTVQSIIKEHYSHDYSHGLVTSARMMAKDEDDDVSVFLPNQTYSLREICYNLFDLDTINDEFYDLLSDNSQDDTSEFDDCPDEENWMNIKCNWEGTSQVLLKWDEFCSNVKHKARFFDHEKYSRLDELSKLDNTFKTLSKKINKELYRARIIEDEKIEAIDKNPSKELGIAPLEKAKHNRFSPVGIPYVYLSSDKKTILEEIRVKKGKTVAIGTFEIKNLNLVDLRNKNLSEIRSNPFDESCTSEILCSFKTIEKFVRDISLPIKEEDNKLDYIPTQIVSEYIWYLKYDGFIFDSSLCDGDNYVLFHDKYDLKKHDITVI